MILSNESFKPLVVNVTISIFSFNKSIVGIPVGLTHLCRLLFVSINIGTGDVLTNSSRREAGCEKRRGSPSEDDGR